MGAPLSARAGEGPGPDAAVEARDLHRRYFDHHAVNGLSFSVGRGEVVGLLGLNGAGKSTALAMLAGALAPSTGRVLINGLDLARSGKTGRRAVGYLPDHAPLYDDLSVAEFLNFCAALRGVPAPRRSKACQRTIDTAGLGAVSGRRLGNLSKGYRQRVGIAQTLVHEPVAVFLDEPASGLDPAQTQALRQLLRATADERDAGVLLSSHSLTDVQAVCSRVLVMHEGRLVLDAPLGAAGEIERARLAGVGDGGLERLAVRFARPPAAAVLGKLTGVANVETVGSRDGGRFTLAGQGPLDALSATVTRASLDGDWGLVELAPGSASLERVFLDLVRNGERAIADAEPD